LSAVGSAAGRRTAAAAVVCCAVLWTAAVAAAPTFPQPVGYVNDFANLLTPSDRSSLDAKLANYRAATGNEIAVAIFPDLGGDPIDDFTVRLEEAWKVGHRGQDNGVLILVAVRERAVRIEVGYGLESRVTDAQAGAIIRDKIAPAFRSNDYAGGLNAAVDALIALIGAPSGAAPPATSTPSNAPDLWGALWWLLPLGWFVLVGGLARLRGRRCPRCGERLVSKSAGGGNVVWTCPRCGYRETQTRSSGPSFLPVVPLGGWGSGGFSGGGGGGFGGFGGGSSGGGGASGGW
jgi:uncharacterized protein